MYGTPCLVAQTADRVHIGHLTVIFLLQDLLELI